MTKEEKQLLLKDLCGRTTYGVKFTLSDNNIYTMKGIDLIVTDEGDWEYAVAAKGITPIEIKYVKPYLRPMSSMTEKEKGEYFGRNMTIDIVETSQEVIDYCNAHHLDYRHLIEKGLALEAPEDMYKFE